MDYLSFSYYFWFMTTLDKVIIYLQGYLVYTDLDECESKTMKKILKYAESIKEEEIEQIRDAFEYPCPDPAFHNVKDAFEKYYTEKFKKK